MSATATKGATDCAEFITDLDGGQFDRLLSVALSQVAAGVVDNDGKGTVAIEFAFTKVPGATQVICAHKLKFMRPTADGKASEEITRKTSMHVGTGGRLSIVPESQRTFLDRQGQLTTNN